MADELQCTGPFSDARICPVHKPQGDEGRAPEIPQQDLHGKLIGIDALLINALAVCDGEGALRLTGSRELVADALVLLDQVVAALTQLREERAGFLTAMKADELVKAALHESLLEAEAELSRLRDLSTALDAERAKTQELEPVIVKQADGSEALNAGGIIALQAKAIRQLTEQLAAAQDRIAQLAHENRETPPAHPQEE